MGYSFLESLKYVFRIALSRLFMEIDSVLSAWPVKENSWLGFSGASLHF